MTKLSKFKSLDIRIPWQYQFLSCFFCCDKHHDQIFQKSTINGKNGYNEWIFIKHKLNVWNSYKNYSEKIFRNHLIE